MGHLIASAAPFAVAARLVAFVVDALTAAVSADVELWACDGCSFTGTAVECDDHVTEQVLRADGSVRDWADVSCHGSYLVGGPAWEAHVFHGVHPMAMLTADIADLARRHGAL